jgi:hypothetical protein
MSTIVVIIILLLLAGSARFPLSSSPLLPGSSAILRRQTGHEAAGGSFLPQMEHVRAAGRGIDPDVSVSASSRFSSAELIAPNDPLRRPAPRRAIAPIKLSPRSSRHFRTSKSCHRPVWRDAHVLDNIKRDRLHDAGKQKAERPRAAPPVQEVFLLDFVVPELVAAASFGTNRASTPAGAWTM